MILISMPKCCKKKENWKCNIPSYHYSEIRERKRQYGWPKGKVWRPLLWVKHGFALHSTGYRENITNLTREGRGKYMRTHSGTFSGKHTLIVTCMHMHKPTQLTHRFGRGAEADHRICKMTYSKAWKREEELRGFGGVEWGGLSKDHLATSGSTICIPLLLISFPCILIFALPPVLSIYAVIVILPSSSSLSVHQEALIFSV